MLEGLGKRTLSQAVWCGWERETYRVRRSTVPCLRENQGINQHVIWDEARRLDAEISFDGL